MDAERATLLEASGLVRAFGSRKAVNDVSLTVAQGECIALFGPNGAGKTTLLKMLGGLLKPTKGSVKLSGTELPGPAHTRRLVGLISHHPMLYPALTVSENLRFAAASQGVVNGEHAVRAILDQLGVLDRFSTPVRLLSRGLQQRVSIARALVHSPQLILLDEPYTGLDEVGAQMLTSLLRNLKASGAAMVLVTHHLAEGLAFADKAVVIRAGKLVHQELAEEGQFHLPAFQLRYRQLVHEAIA